MADNSTRLMDTHLAPDLVHRLAQAQIYTVGDAKAQSYFDLRQLGFGTKSINALKVRGWICEGIDFD